MRQLYIGLIAEGNTDYRFFQPLIEKILIRIAHDCKGAIDINLKLISDCKEKGNSFVDHVIDVSKKALSEYGGITTLIIHNDADKSSAQEVYETRINPAKKALKKSKDLACINLIALIPIQETESWMLADKFSLIKAIGTKKTENELKINGNPETFSDPKQKIEDAIRFGRSDMPKKIRNSLKLSDLYSLLGQQMNIDTLNSFKSFIDFEKNIKAVLKKQNLL